MYKSRLSVFKPKLFSSVHRNKKNLIHRLEPESTQCLHSSSSVLPLSDQEATAIYGGVASLTEVLVPNRQKEQEQEQKTDNVQKKDQNWSPSVQTLLEQPSASFPGRIIIGGMVFCLALGTWSYVGQIEEVGVAQGKLVPQGQTYKIEPVSAGQVTQLAVEEGDTVQAGQTIAELDTELAQQEVERLQQLLSNYQQELIQKQILLERVSLEAQTQSAISSAETRAQESTIAQLTARISTTRQLLAQLRSEEQLYQRRQTLVQPVSQLAQTRMQQLEAESKAHQERLERLEPLVAEGAISQEFLFQAQQSYLQTQQQLTQSRLQKITGTDEQLFQVDQSLRDRQTRITQSQGELAAALKESERLQAELAQKQAQEQRTTLEAQQRIQQLELEITQLRGRIKDAENQLTSAQARLKQRFLYAPVDGVVLSLNVQNTGKFVQSGQTIAEIAPQDAPLVLSATIPGRDAGFIEVGMPVKMKLDAYPYQDYGIIAGEVTSISADAEIDPTIGAVYRVEISLEKDYVIEEQQQVEFKAGQTASADIVIRRRRIADILLEPIRKLREDGISM